MISDNSGNNNQLSTKNESADVNTDIIPVHEVDYEYDELDELDEDFSEERMNEILEQTEELYFLFVESPHFENLTEEQKSRSETIIYDYTNYAYQYESAEPKSWDFDIIKICCLELFPRKVSAEISFFEDTAPVLSEFFKFIEDEGVNKLGYEMAEAVMEIKGQIVREASDPSRWGIAKSFVMSAYRDGVDVTDIKELQAYSALKMDEGIRIKDEEKKMKAGLRLRPKASKKVRAKNKAKKKQRIRTKKKTKKKRKKRT